VGKTSNAAKQTWNKNHYTQIKVAVKHQTAAGFKAACAAAGTSMVSELAGFMDEYTNPAEVKETAPIRVKTLGDRRKAMARICSLMTEVRDAEEEYMNRIPENLQSSSRYDDADERLGKLDEAIDIISDIYLQ
jgi:hypothetical protein